MKNQNLAIKTNAVLCQTHEETKQKHQFQTKLQTQDQAKIYIYIYWESGIAKQLPGFSKLTGFGKQSKKYAGNYSARKQKLK